MPSSVTSRRTTGPNPDLVPRWALEYGPPPPLEEPTEPEVKPEPEAMVVAPAAPPESKRRPELWQMAPPPNPPFDPTPEESPELGSGIDLTAIVASRLQKKAKKAESRREAKRRKVERLRA